MARYDDLNTGSIAYATFLSTIVLLIVILLVRALCLSWVEGEDERKLANAHYVSADQEISEQREQLSGYKQVQVKSVDETVPPKTLVHIPLDAAKELILKELGQASSK